MRSIALHKVSKFTLFRDASLKVRKARFWTAQRTKIDVRPNQGSLNILWLHRLPMQCLSKYPQYVALLCGVLLLFFVRASLTRARPCFCATSRSMTIIRDASVGSPMNRNSSRIGVKCSGDGGQHPSLCFSTGCEHCDVSKHQ